MEPDEEIPEPENQESSRDLGPDIKVEEEVHHEEDSKAMLGSLDNDDTDSEGTDEAEQ